MTIYLEGGLERSDTWKKYWQLRGVGWQTLSGHPGTYFVPS